MPIATVCPQCRVMFRTPVDVLRRGDGRVQCGECSNVFVGLLHALVLDSPIVEHLGMQSMEVLAQRRRPMRWVAGFFIVCTVLAAFILHLGLERGALSLNAAQAAAPVYKILGLGMPAYRGVEAFVLGPSVVRKNDAGAAVLTVTLYNRAPVPVEWPGLRVEVLDRSGKVMYDAVMDSRNLQGSQPAGPMGGLSEVSLSAHVPPDKVKAGDGYRLEIVAR